MPHDLLLQGRRLSAPELAQIQHGLAAHPAGHRTRLSRELCALWDWRNAAGQFKDMACRSLLLQLEARGLITLPPRQRASVNGQRHRRPVAVACDTTPLQAELLALQPLRVEPLPAGRPDLALFQGLLQQHHYLGHRNCVGENLKDLVRDGQGRPLGCVLFGSAAWQCQPRDAFIGWSSEQRRAGLARLTNNTRFLILPWVRVPQLASHVLSRVCRRLSRDWQEKYGHAIELVETFVERDRFAGTCYRAAGWTRVGATTGRGRNGGPAAPGPVKEVYVRPLHPEFRRRLGA
jgi:hypothetical protein